MLLEFFTAEVRVWLANMGLSFEYGTVCLYMIPTRRYETSVYCMHVVSLICMCLNKIWVVFFSGDSETQESGWTFRGQ